MRCWGIFLPITYHLAVDNSQFGVQTAFRTHTSNLSFKHRFLMNVECACALSTNGQRIPQDRAFPYEPCSQTCSKAECVPCSCSLIGTAVKPQSAFLSAATIPGHQGRARFRACLILLLHGPVLEQPWIVTRSLFVLLGSLHEVWLAPILQLRCPQMGINLSHTHTPPQ